MEDMLKVFMMDGGAARTTVIKGAFTTTGELVAESWEEMKLAPVCSLAIATEMTPKGFLKMNPRDVVKDNGRPLLFVHEIVMGVVFHHILTEIVAAATGVAAGATNNEKALCGGKGERRGC
jgi:hypothetical protein